MKKPLLIILALLLASAPALATDPAVENTVKAMDAKAANGKISEVLAEAKARLGREDSAANRYLLGRAYGMNREYEKAREQFERALELDMGSPLAYHGLGAYYLVKGDMDEAERMLLKAVRLDKTFTRAHVELGKLYMARMDTLSATRQFLKVLDYDPDDNQVRTLLAYQYLKEKRWQTAADEFLVVLSKDPDHVGAMKGIAITYSMEKKTDQAIAAFEKVITRDPKDLDSYVFLTGIYRDSGKKEKALETLERLLKVVPEDSPVAGAVREEMKSIREGRRAGKTQVTLPILIEQLRTGSVEVRREAIARLANAGLARPPREVVRAVKDKDAVVRTIAIRWLGSAGGPRVLALLEILARHPKDHDANEMVRATVAQAIGNVGDAAGIPVLLSLIVEDESQRVYRASIQGLRDLTGQTLAGEEGEAPDAAGREALANAWNEWWMGPRALSRKLDAIETIGSLASRRMSRYLVPLMGDTEALVAGPAREAFGRSTGVEIGTPEDVKTPEGRAALMKQALVTLRELDRKAKGPKKPAK